MQVLTPTPSRFRAKLAITAGASCLVIATIAMSSFAFTAVADGKREARTIRTPAPSELGETVPPAIEPPEYDARGKRDPFVSPLRTDQERNPLGLDVDALELQGIVETPNGFTAMLQGPDRETYFVKKGERFFNGTLESIDRRSLTFRVPVRDPLGIGRVRQVVLELYPTN